MYLEDWQRDELKRDLDIWLNESKINPHKVAEVVNRYLHPKHKLKVEIDKRYTTKILLTTGVGNTIQGGADIWVNNFLKEVWPKLPQPRTWKLLIDSKRPTNFDPKSLPKGLHYHFHGDDPRVTKKLLEECSEIHSLHSHYHKRDHIWHYEDKFKTIFVHAYPREMKETIDKIEELKRLQFNTKVDEKWYDDYIGTFRKRIWIGCNPTSMFDEHPNYSYTIPNYYEFIRNHELTSHIDNGKVGFTSRAESRKCLHWLHNQKGLALTSRYDVKNLKETTAYTLPNIQIYQWESKIHNIFMAKNWGIFHGAYFKEPFGYSIFQAVDWGKLPIIHTDWCSDLEYKYRAGTYNEFNKIVKQILKDSHQERQENFNRLKNYLKKYDYKDKWVSDIIDMITK